MPPKTFEEVWLLLRQLEGVEIETLSLGRRNLIGTFNDREMTRQTRANSGDGWRPQKPIRKRNFENLWNRLSADKCVEIRSATGYIYIPAACFAKVGALGVEVTSKRPLTLRLAQPDKLNTNRGDDDDEEEFGDLQRIVVDPEICSGKPTIRRTRIMVSNVLGMFAGGYTINRIQKAYPELSRLDVISAVEYASRVIDGVRKVGRG